MADRAASGPVAALLLANDAPRSTRLECARLANYDVVTDLIACEAETEAADVRLGASGSCRLAWVARVANDSVEAVVD